MAKITVICGLIGAGKTTYAREHFEHYTDFDTLHSKQEQIQDTWALLCECGDVAHITCYPTPGELAFFSALSKDKVEYIWLTATEEQARRNIEARGRERDAEYSREVLDKNRELTALTNGSMIPFRYVEVFPSGESW